MKKSEKFEDSWDDDNLRKSRSFKSNILIASVIGALSVGGFTYLSSSEDADDARMHYIRQDYAQSLKVIESILSDPELSMQYAQALEIKSEILMDSKSEFFDRNSAYITLKDLFAESKSVDTARKLVEIGDSQKKKEKELEQFIVYLANNKDIDSIYRISRFYLSSESTRDQLKARKFLEMLPETTEKLISLSKVELAIGKSSATIKNAESYLNSAVLLGSPDAMAELAFLQLTKAEIDKFSSQKHKAQFPLMIKRSIDMGYNGELLPKAALILKFGRFGVPQDLTLANTIEKLVGNE
ncbi:hypothetical protein QTV49_000326 [Vibrio vulnificus]|nr:hypothetical protein [Vibrio vulnificus]